MISTLAAILSRKYDIRTSFFPRHVFPMSITRYQTTKPVSSWGWVGRYSTRTVRYGRWANSRSQQLLESATRIPCNIKQGVGGGIGQSETRVIPGVRWGVQ